MDKEHANVGPSNGSALGPGNGPALGQSPDNPRRRVVCYITRQRQDLLVFLHNDPGLEAGLQVVAGGIDAGETVGQAAVRESFEEAGLRLFNPVPLGELPHHSPGTKYPFQQWCFCWLEASDDTPDAWSHTVSAGEEDAGMVYQHFFRPIQSAAPDWGLGKLLFALQEKIKSQASQQTSPQGATP